MMTVKEVSRRTGVSVRALRYYDKIGLLRPQEISDAGYRLYDDTALFRLQKILLLRELQFSLKDIGLILDSPKDDSIHDALERQIRILRMKQEHLEQIIGLALEYKEKGEMTMDFSAFDTNKMKEYEKEAKERWGETAAYKEWEATHKKEDGDFTPESYATKTTQMNKYFQAFGELKDRPADDGAVRSLIREYQEFITKNYYTLTDDIFLGLADLYVQDERFTKNIDAQGGPGCAAFLSAAIKACTKV